MSVDGRSDDCLETRHIRHHFYSYHGFFLQPAMKIRGSLSFFRPWWSAAGGDLKEVRYVGFPARHPL
ncbi:hypothetical protein DENIT_80154 [Pseudomonas veronii]|nr:hypothetical protein DENIT_80154 [Pseudomonas veronii]